MLDYILFICSYFVAPESRMDVVSALLNHCDVPELSAKGAVIIKAGYSGGRAFRGVPNVLVSFY